MTWLWCGTLAALIITSLIVQSCSSSKNVIGHERLHTPQEVLARVNQRNAAVKTLQGDGFITIESPEGSYNGSFDAMIMKPDSLCVELNGPLGIHFGSLFLSREHFIFYNRLENTAIVGTPDGTTLHSLFRLKMQFDEVINSFTGEFPAISSSDSAERFSTSTDGQYIITYKTPEGKKEYRIDEEQFVVVWYRVFDNEGNALIKASAGEIEESGGIPVPRFLRVIFPKENRSMTIAYDNVSVNVPATCNFILPKQVEIIQH